MALPVPNLDDRRFQDLVDDAKRLVQQRCPEWTDHNVSDPGVTLIELFAWMTDQLLYRVNRVPDRNYVKFLELIGIRLFPPSAARGDVTLAVIDPAPMATPAELPPVELGHKSRAIDALMCRALLEGCKKPLPDGLHFESEMFGQCCGTEDMRIGVKNFLANGPRVKAEFVHR